MQTDGSSLPLTEQQQAQVSQRVFADIGRAGAIIDLPLAPIPVHFDLRGRAAGMYCYREQRHWLRFNPWQFAAHFELHLNDTVTHEVAHYAIHSLLPRGRFKPHGPEWQGLMIALGANPKATFHADMSGVPIRRQRRYQYRCLCREHEVSSTRHNRIRLRGAQYRCRYCDGVLRSVSAQA
ncbi:MAG: hypothetical protein RLZZ602_2081 [Pseudomonadota bacterium]